MRKLLFVCAWMTCGRLSAGLDVFPKSLTLYPSDPIHHTLVLADSADVTEQVKWTVEDPAIARVEGLGGIRWLAPGKTRVRVAFAGATTWIAVECRGGSDQVSFGNDVVPILTRFGCNQGACHGKNAGQNGFRLSLRGYAVDDDHYWITREHQSRRVNFGVPTESLLVSKPAGRVPHAGGLIFTEQSRAFATLTRWINQGASGPGAGDVPLVRLELMPGDRTLAPTQRQRLLAQATYADGATRDVTWLTVFASNDATIADVSSAGVVRAIRPGATAIRAHFQGLATTIVITCPSGLAIPADRYAGAKTLVDEPTFALLRKLGVPPAPVCDDATFHRRVSLDIAGVLPTPDEVRSFLADPQPNKRAALVDRLLERPEYVDWWTLKLADLFQNRKERDHDVRGVKGVRAFHAWLRRQVASNRPWNEIARAVLLAKGDSSKNPEIGPWIVTVGEVREGERSEAPDAIAQALLGTRIGCAKCHNHPLEKYTQDDYYHFAGFFSRLRFERKEPLAGATLLQVSMNDPNRNYEPIGAHQPRTGQFLAPRPLDRSSLTLAPGDDPREKLADWMTQPGNPFFAGAMVNRVWKSLLGVGLVEPVDDLRASNPPTNPALWKALENHFVASQYDLKALIRVITNSRTYQTQATTEPANEKDAKFYSHFYVRRLPAEVMLDAICQATGVPEKFPGYPLGVRAVQTGDPGVESYFLAQFGRSPRVTACACERSEEVTVSQLLNLQNGQELLNKINAPTGRLRVLLDRNEADAKVVDEIFLATLSRFPTTSESATIQKELAANEKREEVFRDLLWAILNSKGFAFNR